MFAILHTKKMVKGLVPNKISIFLKLSYRYCNVALHTLKDDFLFFLTILLIDIKISINMII